MLIAASTSGCSFVDIFVLSSTTHQGSGLYSFTISLKAGETLNYESQTIYTFSLLVRDTMSQNSASASVCDANGACRQPKITINVQNVVEGMSHPLNYFTIECFDILITLFL